MLKTLKTNRLTESAKIVAEMDHHIAKYPERRAAIMPILKIAEREFGWLTEEAMACVAEVLSLTKAEVYGVATYYTMYKFRPMGRHIVQFCDNISCMLFTAEQLLEHFAKRWGLHPGETSPDGRFSLVTMECIGACGTAPAMLVNRDFYDNLTEKKIDEILEKYT
jgi:NADH-quinone oxidoreductase E subunit